MNKQRYIALLQDPSSLSKEDIYDLEELILQYPYCQNAHILLAKIQAEQGSMHAAKLSRKAALYTSDRNKLKHLLNNKPSLAKPAIEITVPKEDIEQPTSGIPITEAPDTIPQAPIETAEQPLTRHASSDPKESTLIEELSPKKVFSEVKKEADKNVSSFLEELDKNLKELRESRARAAGLLPPFTQEEVDALNQKDAVAEVEMPSFESDQAITETPASIEPIAIEAESEQEIPPGTQTFPSIETTEPAQKNDVLDLILSFDNRVKDYFDIHQYASKEADSTPIQEKPLEPEQDLFPEMPLPFTTRHWYLEESRMEENSLPASESLLLNYLDYMREQKNKKQKPDKKREKSIISRFIQKDPTISPLSISQASEDEDNVDEKGKSSLQPAFISETFAVLLEKQGKIEKAILVYEELILKNPEKKPYFAARIQELKKKYNIQ